MKFIYPNIDWYTEISEQKKATPRCPYANVHRCPRYFSSLYLLGEGGVTTKIKSEKVKELDEFWGKSDLLPVIAEHDTGILSSGDNKSGFSNFCPEISFDVFGLFAISLHRYSDEIDIEVAHAQLAKKAYPKDWRWQWAHVEPLHYLKCPVYSQLASKPAQVSGQSSRKKTTKEMIATSHTGMNMANIFITYSRQEANTFAARVAKKLKTIGHNVVWDVKLSLGESTFGVIKDNHTNVIILIATNNYALDESSEEFEAVRDYTLEVDDVVILPIRLGSASIPAQFSEIASIKLKKFEEVNIDSLVQELNSGISNFFHKLNQPKESRKRGVSMEKGLQSVQNKNIWDVIQDEFDISKRAFGKKINFVSDKFKRKIIFRDIEQAYVLAKRGFCKPAVILSGGVIEELLRLYLDHHNVSYQGKTFDSYIKACADNGLIKISISRLSDSVRHFRNLVHLSREDDKSHTISKATASGAVSSIFTIANDF